MSDILGPQIPPHILAKRKHAAEEEEVAANVTSDVPCTSPEPDQDAKKKKRIAGPAPPPAPLEERPPGSVSGASEDESSSDDDFGPALPSAARTEVRERLHSSPDTN